MVVGDSVALSLGLGLRYQEPKYHITAMNLGISGCGVALGTYVWTAIAGQLQESVLEWPCRPRPLHGYVPWPQAWPSWLREIRPNLVVLLAGRWELVDRLYQGHRTNILHPDFAGYVKYMLNRAVTLGTSTGAKMVLMTAPCLAVFEQPDGSPYPEDDIHRVQAYNRLVKEVGAKHPSTVTVQDLYSMTCPHGKFTPTLAGAPLRTPDGIHFEEAPGTGADLLAPRLLPLWEELGHEQEAGGGNVVTGPLPAHLSPA